MNATFPCPVVLTKSLAKITPLTIMPLCSLSALSGSSVYSLTVPPLPPPPDQRRRLAASQFTIAPQSRPRTLYRARQTDQVVTAGLRIVSGPESRLDPAPGAVSDYRYWVAEGVQYAINETLCEAPGIRLTR